MDDMTIRKATAADIPQIDKLLRQMLEVHHAGRPDLFKGGVKKYTDAELEAILADDQTPVFVVTIPGTGTDDASADTDRPVSNDAVSVGSSRPTLRPDVPRSSTDQIPG